MKKIIILTLMLFLMACDTVDPVGSDFQSCTVTTQNGRVETWKNVMRIETNNDRTYVKQAVEINIDFWEIKEYFTYDVVSFTCSNQKTAPERTL